MDDKKEHKKILSGECAISSVCLTTAKIWSGGWTSVMAPCYSSVLVRKQRNVHPPGMRAGQNKRHEEKRSPSPQFWHLFLCFFSSTGPALSKLGWPGGLFYLRSSPWSSDHSLFYFHRFFPSLSFSHHHSGLLFPILTT